MAESVRCWLVERDVEDGRVVSAVYATTDGTRSVRRQHALGRHHEGLPAGIEVDPSALRRVESSEDRERYREEARAVADRHAASDRI